MARLEASRLVEAGVDAETAPDLAKRANDVLERHSLDARTPAGQQMIWDSFREILADPSYGHASHAALFQAAFEGREASDGPAPAWSPTAESIARTNVGRLMMEKGFNDYRELHRWSTTEREAFWSTTIATLGIIFKKRPDRMLDPESEPTAPRWLPGAELNIAESHLKAERTKTAIVYRREGATNLRRVTYAELEKLAARIANGLDRLGLPPDAKIALYMPMNVEAVAIYLGIIKSGRAIVGIPDSAAPEALSRRLEIAKATLIFTVDSYSRGGKEFKVYENAKKAGSPRAVVLPSEWTKGFATAMRGPDMTWGQFLSSDVHFASVMRKPGDHSNVLFSSGTTGDPKAIPWTHVTPIKSASDAYWHHDVKAEDVLCWPTSYGWMMGQWLTAASFVNDATMALYNGNPAARGFGEFVRDAGVTLLGTVPKIVQSWRTNKTMEGLDWGKVRLFSSTAEPSQPEDTFYLSWLASKLVDGKAEYTQVMEYSGGTETGGGLNTGTLARPWSPSTFSTPALGLDFVVFDEHGNPSEDGEIGVIGPWIGQSTELLNYDNRDVYYEGMPRGPNGEILRRHGDHLKRLGKDYWRHLGRIDDMININGVKTSSEEIRAAIRHTEVVDTKPIAVTDVSGQHRLVVYAIPKEPTVLASKDSRSLMRAELKTEFAKSIKAKVSPLVGHVHDVVLVQAFETTENNKTKTRKWYRADYERRIADGDL
ncbi:MAG: AMP-binding protein [Euryarchaeota archaeon]|nr:AMP-binding protein [Euryarchaeota archaeon]